MKRLMDGAAATVETVAAFCLALVTLTVFVSAIGRYLFASPIPDSFDVSRLLLGLAIAWGFAVLGFRGGHICVDLLAEALPSGPRRWVEVLAQAVLLIFTVLLAWKVLSRVESAYASGEATFDLRLPVWPLVAGIWAGFAAAVVTTAAGLVVLLKGGRLEGLDPQEDTHE
ncbi:TRAP transporter small permease [Citreimonas salinaria]|uniref:TRAP transporter small permease protein n=1 Tax=Citreimonas salinaria TaxID=321339 RepID=A0A1H3L987_9RHOB|nr:TRAP transporter small permease [Citreimonas salinaria]SDY60846.1 TRAP-type C4-dicarboxylate transport system, small permease component [Citreimonas salinaria]